MESILQIICILSILKFSYKATFYRKYWGILVFSALSGIFAYIIHPFVIENNIQLFSGILSDKEKVTNLALVITAEAISGIMISIGMLQNLIKTKTSAWFKLLKLSPGLIIAGAVFYIELKSFYFFSGISFWATALIISAAISLSVAIISYLIKLLLPANNMRYELKFIINVILLIVAVIMNAGLAAYNQSSYNAEPGLLKLFVMLILVAAIASIGFFIQKMKHKGKFKFLHKWI